MKILFSILVVFVFAICSAAAQPFNVLQRLSEMRFGNAAWGDYDGDQDLDILLTGHGELGWPALNQYQNRHRVPNAPPAPPLF